MFDDAVAIETLADKKTHSLSSSAVTVCLTTALLSDAAVAIEKPADYKTPSLLSSSADTFVLTTTLL